MEQNFDTQNHATWMPDVGQFYEKGINVYSVNHKNDYDFLYVNGVLKEAEKYYNENLKKQFEEEKVRFRGYDWQSRTYKTFTIVADVEDILRHQDLFFSKRSPYEIYTKRMNFKPNYKNYLENEECRSKNDDELNAKYEPDIEYRRPQGNRGRFLKLGSLKHPQDDDFHPACRIDYKLTKVLFFFRVELIPHNRGNGSYADIAKSFGFKFFPEKVGGKPLFRGKKPLFSQAFLEDVFYKTMRYDPNGWENDYEGHNLFEKGYKEFEGVWGAFIEKEIGIQAKKMLREKDKKEEQKEEEEQKKKEERKKKEYKNDYKSVTLKRFYSKELASAYKKEISKTIPADLSNVGGLRLIVDQHVRDNKGRTAYNVRLVPQNDLGEKKLALFRGLQTEDDQRRKGGRRGAVNKNKKKRTPTKR